MVDINRYLRVHSRRTLYLMNLAVRALARGSGISAVSFSVRGSDWGVG
jgi:hypothetical protein